MHDTTSDFFNLSYIVSTISFFFEFELNCVWVTQFKCNIRTAETISLLHDFSSNEIIPKSY